MRKRNIVKVFLLNDGSQTRISDTRSEKETLLDLLVEKTKKIRHQLSWQEASSIPDMVKPSEFINYGFSSFDEAAKTAWFKVKPKDKSGLTKQGKKLKAALRKQRAT